MKNIFSLHVKRIAAFLCVAFIACNIYAQGNDAKAQPIKKDNSKPASATGNNSAKKPWEKQPIAPGSKAGAATPTKTTGTQPASQAQPIQKR